MRAFKKILCAPVYIFGSACFCVYMHLPVSVCLIVLLLFLLLHRDRSLIPGGLLGTMTRDVSPKAIILRGGCILQHPFSVSIEALGILLCSFSYILPLLSSLDAPLRRSITERKCFL